MPALTSELIDEGLCSIVAGNYARFEKCLHQSCRVLTRHPDSIRQLTRVLRALGEQANDFQLRLIESNLL